MLCQICQKNAIKMKITKLEHGVATEYNVCEECAAKVSEHRARLIKSQASKQDVEQLLKELIEEKGMIIGAGEQAVSGEDVPVCPECGLDYLTYRRTYMLGCAQCYDSFGELLLKDLEKIHGTTSHIDAPPLPTTTTPAAPAKASPPAPPPPTDDRTKLRQLQRQLQKSIDAEDFDHAAALRDEIRELEKQLASQSSHGENA